MKTNIHRLEQAKARLFLDEKKQKSNNSTAIRDLFGIWKNRDIDAQKLRTECQGLNI